MEDVTIKQEPDQEQQESETEQQQPEQQSEPLAKTRTRRANAGARMHEMIFAAEDDELFAQTYGGLLKGCDEDSSEDEEYIPKDLDDSSRRGENGDGNNDEQDDDDDAEDDDDDNVSDSDSDSDSGDDDSISDSDEGSDFDDTKDDDVNEYDDNKLNFKTEDRKIPLIKEPGSPSRAAYESCRKICSVCLGDKSDEDNEIIDCDSCGVSVHESCYGVLGESSNHSNNHNNSDSETKKDNDTISLHSNLSSESTEPWFCEPCRRSVKNPFCELCPNLGGIFKQTDTGRWIHMVCALYTRGVTFENVDSLSEVSLFELNYSLYGSKACTICEDRRLARSGVCIGCDAGLCKTFFHVTCAQREGLLFESHSDEVDPYFAQCKQHADKTIIKKQKRTCSALFARLKKLSQNPRSQSQQERIHKKLLEITLDPDPHMTKWSRDNRPPIPVKVSRSLMTSPSLIMRLTKKSELMGLDPKSAFMTVQDEMEMARQKWHIPPAFNLEFVAYCRDRTTRMVSMKKKNVELVNQNIKLKNEEASLRGKFNSIKELAHQQRYECEIMIKEARALQKLVATSTGRPFQLPLQMEQLIARCNNTKSRNQHAGDNERTSKHTANNHASNKTSSTYGCGKCGTVKDQHLLALCDTCNSYIHIYCLDPPLTRVPKKTKFGGWQCSDCSERDEEEQEEALEEQNILAIQEAAQDGPRRLRERIKFPEKYCHESMMMADFWSTHKKKSKKSSKGGSKSGHKKPKLEQ